MKKLFTIGIVLFLSGCSIIDIFSKDPELYIDAMVLGEAYKENEVTASDEYDDKYVQVTGVISYISSDKDEVTIQIFGGVVCIVSSDLDSVDDLKVYSKVILNGDVKGLDDAYAVIINKCELEEVVTTPEVVTTSVELSGLNIDEIGYKIIEVTGEAEYIDIFAYTGWTLVTEDVNNSLAIVFDSGFDFSGIETGDTITVIGTFIPYVDFRTNSPYKVYCYDILDIVSGS